MPLYIRKEFVKDVHLLVWHITESEDYLRGEISLHPGDMQKLQGIIHPARRKEVIATRLCISHFFQEYPELSYDENGCPALNNDYHLSISHTNYFAAVALSKKHRVGLDIETRSNRIGRIEKRFVNDREQAYIPEKEKVDYLTAIWGAKEATVKIQNNRKIDFKNQLEVEKFDFDKCLALARYQGTTNQEIQLKFERKDNLMITLAWI